MEKIIISTEQAPKAIGPYSQAVRFGNLVFLSGQLGLDPATGTLKDGIVAQTRQSLDNIGAILTSLGLTYAHVVKTTVLSKTSTILRRSTTSMGQFFVRMPPRVLASKSAGCPNARWSKSNASRSIPSREGS